MPTRTSATTRRRRARRARWSALRHLHEPAVLENRPRVVVRRARELRAVLRGMADPRAYRRAVVRARRSPRRAPFAGAGEGTSRAPAPSPPSSVGARYSDSPLAHAARARRRRRDRHASARPPSARRGCAGPHRGEAAVVRARVGNAWCSERSATGAPRERVRLRPRPRAGSTAGCSRPRRAPRGLRQRGDDAQPQLVALRQVPQAATTRRRAVRRRRRAAASMSRFDFEFVPAREEPRDAPERGRARLPRFPRGSRCIPARQCRCRRGRELAPVGRGTRAPGFTLAARRGSAVAGGGGGAHVGHRRRRARRASAAGESRGAVVRRRRSRAARRRPRMSIKIRM